jgi:hypothetical protein
MFAVVLRLVNCINELSGSSSACWCVRVYTHPQQTQGSRQSGSYVSQAADSVTSRGAYHRYEYAKFQSPSRNSVFDGRV